MIREGGSLISQPAMPNFICKHLVSIGEDAHHWGLLGHRREAGPLGRGMSLSVASFEMG